MVAEAVPKRGVGLDAPFLEDQILGWREYIRGLYWSYRDKWLKTNYLNHDRALPAFYWHANTDMQCMQQSISQVLEHGYGHHIQRLMVTGLFSLLWGVHPEAIHRWYLGMYVDAVAWVEIPLALSACRDTARARSRRCA